MADKSKIHWTDATWHPVTGCSVISAGCKNCYAMKLAGGRLRNHDSRAGLTDDSAAGPVWNGTVRFNEDWLDQPLKWKRPRRIFVCGHGDLFHEAVPDDWIDTVFQIIDLARHHTFQILTKRPDRMRAFMRDNPEWHLPNLWLGVSAEDQATADARIPALMETPAAIRWVSYEPALGPVDFSPWVPPVLATLCSDVPSSDLMDQLVFAAARGVRHRDPDPVPGIDWIVAGGESGLRARPALPGWYRAVRDLCRAGAVPFFFKQWGAWVPAEAVAARSGYAACATLAGDRWDFEEFDLSALDLQIDPLPDVFRAGRKSGDLPVLDGVTYGEFPA